MHNFVLTSLVDSAYVVGREMWMCWPANYSELLSDLSPMACPHELCYKRISDLPCPTCQPPLWNVVSNRTAKF
ncbi:unnamed protein product [Protopolystoma xenopodis]|uniref:Uncharacterized protein n=1 Tax=Protopolystoma xenopodis TaxID=117903 RepID=A0A448WQI7_9PLAT|nr:unnamed protein product [Protopolystoma xenopodis]